jgi:hypothetical protein
VSEQRRAGILLIFMHKLVKELLGSTPGVARCSRLFVNQASNRTTRKITAARLYSRVVAITTTVLRKILFPHTLTGFLRQLLSWWIFYCSDQYFRLICLSRYKKVCVSCSRVSTQTNRISHRYRSSTPSTE